MAKSTGIVLTATGISFGNEWINRSKPNFRVLVAGLGVALVFDGIEKVNVRAAVGLSTIMLLTVLLAPIDGKSPAQTVEELIAGKSPLNAQAAKDAVQTAPTSTGSISGSAGAVVAFALAQVGKPYSFGAAGPDSYDCSGLVMAAWAKAGVSLPHYTVSQFNMGQSVTLANAIPGDVVFYAGSGGTLNAPDHEALYLGAGMVVEAPQQGENVKVVTANYPGQIAGIRRYT